MDVARHVKDEPNQTEQNDPTKEQMNMSRSISWIGSRLRMEQLPGKT